MPSDIIYSNKNSISLLSYNVHEFNNINVDITDITDHTNTLNILQFVIKVNADIVFLQEMFATTQDTKVLYHVLHSRLSVVCMQ